MIRTVIFFLFLWTSLLFSLILFIPAPFILLAGTRKTFKNYVASCTGTWANFILFLSGTRLQVKGMENLPSAPGFIIVSNHQGFMDIPVLMHLIKHPLSFITKKSLMKVPLINFWIMALDCLIIDRKKPVQSYRRIKEKLQDKEMNPLVIFPEGTRSKSSKMVNIKKGGLSIIERGDLQKVYIEIKGTYKIWEEKKRIQTAIVKVIIHSGNSYKQFFKD